MIKTLSRIKILYLVKTMGVGGAEKFTLNLCRHFSGITKSVAVYSSGGIFVEELNRINVRHLRSGNAKSRNIVKIRSEIRNIIREENFDIIHSQHRIYLPILNSINTGNAKIIYTANNFFNDFYQRLIFPDKAVAISPSIEKNLLGTTLLGRKRVKKINYGVEEGKFNRSSEDTIRLGFVGRLIKEKGIYELIKAMGKLENVRLIICGDGPEKNNIADLTGSKNSRAQIKLLKPAMNMNDVYGKIDVLVLPSILNEGLPISILEAMARKIPVISTSTGAVSDVIIDKVTGLMLENHSAECICEKINWVSNNREKINSIRNAGYNKIKAEYKMETMLEGYEELYSRE